MARNRAVVDGENLSGVHATTDAGSYSEQLLESDELETTLFADSSPNGISHPLQIDSSTDLDSTMTQTPAGFESRAPVTPAPQGPLTYFTQPLPGARSLPATTQRYIAATEADYRAGNLHAALDSAFITVASSPSFVPGYLRLAELSLALNDIDGATRLVETIRLYQDLEDRPDPGLLRAINVAMNPENIDALVEYAEFLLDHNGELPLDPFVPAAIQQTAVISTEISRELFQRYIGLSPDDNELLADYLRAILAGGNLDEFVGVFTRNPRDGNIPADLLYFRAAAAILAGESAWTGWLERLSESLRSDPGQVRLVSALAHESDRIIPEPTRRLLDCCVDLATSNWNGVLETSVNWRESAQSELAGAAAEFIIAYSRFVAAQHLITVDGIDDLEQAIYLLLNQDVAGFAMNTSLFTRPIDLSSCLLEYGSALEHIAGAERGARFLREIRESRPDDPVVRLALAEQLVALGSNKEAIREMYAVARQHETSGNVTEMVAAMRKISTVAEANVELKSMLVEIYYQRGYLDDALVELEAVGRLYLERQQPSTAVETFIRAADIAFGIGDFSRGGDLYDLAVAVDPDDADVRHRAAAYFLQTGSISRATDELREIVDIALAEDDPDEAVASLHQIIALDPHDSEAFHRLGEVLTSIGEYAQAERVYGRLADLQPNDPVLAVKQEALSVLAAPS